MKFTDEQFSAILWVIRVEIQALGQEQNFNGRILAVEAQKFGMTQYALKRLLIASVDMHPIDVMAIISNLDYQDKKYVSAFLWSCFPVIGESGDGKRSLENIAYLCDLPIMNSWEEASEYIRHIPRDSSGKYK